MEERESKIIIEEDRESWNNIKTVFNVILAVLILAYLVLGLYVFGDSIHENYQEKLKESLIAFVILSTSIVGGAYVFIKIYIENQLTVKEKKMIREYERQFNKKIDEQTKSMNEKFNEIDKKFDEQAQSIGALLAIVKSLVKEEKIVPPHNPSTISE